ncbi:MAG TPA: PepSY domain-containing protein [Pseudogracilibacillus sp.]|nr:PepSY domain-containing protein [Pseudogracilibacillus sp.]
MGNKFGQRNAMFALGIGLGFVAGYLLKDQVSSFKKLTPEKALQQAKAILEESGPVNGSWIYMKPETLERNGLTYDTYRGGISRNVDGDNKQYDFHIDIETGAIIDVSEVAS